MFTSHLRSTNMHLFSLKNPAISLYVTFAVNGQKPIIHQPILWEKMIKQWAHVEKITDISALKVNCTTSTSFGRFLCARLLFQIWIKVPLLAQKIVQMKHWISASSTGGERTKHVQISWFLLIYLIQFFFHVRFLFCFYAVSPISVPI